MDIFNWKSFHNDKCIFESSFKIPYIWTKLNFEMKKMYKKRIEWVNLTLSQSSFNPNNCKSQENNEPFHVSQIMMKSWTDINFETDMSTVEKRESQTFLRNLIFRLIRSLNSVGYDDDETASMSGKKQIDLDGLNVNLRSERKYYTVGSSEWRVGRLPKHVAYL